MGHHTAAFFLLICLVFATPVHALQCHEIVPAEAFEAASRVVVAQLKSIQPAANSVTTYELSFDVLDSLKGPSSENLELTLERTRWVDPSHFAVGVKYLWFLEAGQGEVGFCEKILRLEGRAAQWYASWQQKNAR